MYILEYYFPNVFGTVYTPTAEHVLRKRKKEEAADAEKYKQNLTTLCF